jgi:hypothetical protein
VVVEHSKWLWRCGAAVPVVLAAALVLGLAGTASAAEPGVHVDPGSPAGKEYAIPLDQARHDAGLPPGGGNTGGGGGSPGSGGSQLFGAGVVSRASSGSGVRAGGGSSGNAVKHAPASHAPALPAAASTGAGSDTSQAVLIAIAVLAAGCLSGLAVRRLGRPRA